MEVWEEALGGRRAEVVGSSVCLSSSYEGGGGSRREEDVISGSCAWDCSFSSSAITSGESGLFTTGLGIVGRIGARRRGTGFKSCFRGWLI